VLPEIDHGIDEALSLSSPNSVPAYISIYYHLVHVVYAILVLVGMYQILAVDLSSD
jgi:hypothetical protein